MSGYINTTNNFSHFKDSMSFQYRIGFYTTEIIVILQKR